MASTTTHSAMNITNLPLEMIDKILSYLSYDQVARLRAVNQLFNVVCSDKLNKGFLYVNQFHNRCLKAVKSKLPRRESERRHHPLARHCDILMAVETRLSMLSMTYSKYIEAQQCCFIPGKVLDEALKVLRTVSHCLSPPPQLSPLPSGGQSQFPLLPRPHDFLQEYRDMSSMAMEHFDDKILPGIRSTMRTPGNPPQLYCFKNSTPMVFTPRSVGMRHILRTFKVGSALPAVGQVSGSGANSTSTQVENELEAGQASLWKVYKGLQANKLKYKSVHQSVDKLSRSFRQVLRKIKRENVAVRAQLAQQKVMIKHLRRELRETRAAMSVISKDLSQVEVDQSPSRGTKRKRESCDEDCV